MEKRREKRRMRRMEEILFREKTRGKRKWRGKEKGKRCYII